MDPLAPALTVEAVGDEAEELPPDERLLERLAALDGLQLEFECGWVQVLPRPETWATLLVVSRSGESAYAAVPAASASDQGGAVELDLEYPEVPAAEAAGLPTRCAALWARYDGLSLIHI